MDSFVKVRFDLEIGCHADHRCTDISQLQRIQKRVDNLLLLGISHESLEDVQNENAAPMRPREHRGSISTSCDGTHWCSFFSAAWRNLMFRSAEIWETNLISINAHSWRAIDLNPSILSPSRAPLNRTTHRTGISPFTSSLNARSALSTTCLERRHSIRAPTSIGPAFCPLLGSHRAARMRFHRPGLFSTGDPSVSPRSSAALIASPSASPLRSRGAGDAFGASP